jgi:hypothetical protein
VGRRRRTHARARQAWWGHVGLISPDLGAPNADARQFRVA